jgi:hypothetical protein
MARRKNPAAVALSRLGAKKGGVARAAALTPAERSESARKAVQARWAKSKNGREEMSQTAPATPLIDTSKRALHLCLKRIKNAKNDDELRRLTQELQRIVFHRQYKNAENQEAAASLLHGASR